MNDSTQTPEEQVRAILLELLPPQLQAISDLQGNVREVDVRKFERDQAVTRLLAVIEEERYKAVDDAFHELRTTPKDSWYGTMPEILRSIAVLREAENGDTDSRSDTA